MIQKKNGKEKLRALFFYKQNWGAGRIYYRPTTLMFAIAGALLLASNLGNAFCIVRWMSASGVTAISWQAVSFCEPVLGNTWANIALMLACAVFFCKEIVIQQGDSGKWKLSEKMRWGRRAAAHAAAERKMYREYKNIYNAVHRIVDFYKNASAPGAWKQMNEQLEEIYAMMSMGHGKRCLPAPDELSHVDEEEENFESVMEQIRSFEAEMSELADIWTSLYGFNGVRVGIRNETDVEKIVRIGQSMGIDSIVEGYYEGVPLEDLLA